MSKANPIIIGLGDVGRRMALDDFLYAKGEGERLYELSRGIVTAIDEPAPRRLLLMQEVQRQLHKWGDQDPRAISLMAALGQCRLLIKSLESDRHPDLAIYKTPPPDSERADEIWSRWVPELVVEVVSPSSRHRDFHQKPEEYFEFGVREYWIVDPDAKTMTVLRREGGRWVESVVAPPETHRTLVLPGLEFSIAEVFEAT